MNFLDKFKRRIANRLLKHLFKAVTLDDVVSNDPKTKALLIDEKIITANELRELHAEIKSLEGFRIWKLMSHTTKHLAEEMIFVKAASSDESFFGKAMLYNLSLQESIVRVIKSKNL